MMKPLTFALASLTPTILAQEATSAQDATSFALLYGYPLLAFQTFADRFLQYNVSNILYNAQDLSTADNRTVVRPNIDTLYSAVLYDLSQTDLAIQVPEVPDSQFALFSYYDPYGDNYATSGSGTSFKQPGKYLLQRPSNGSLEIGVVPRDRSIVTSEFVADVYSPTTYGTILIRWLVNATNLDAKSGMALTSLGTPAILSSGQPAEQVLKLLASYAQYDPPEIADLAVYVQAQLENAGVTGNSYTAPSGVDLEAANNTALSTISQAATNSSNIQTLNNGWYTTTQGVAGTFDNGTNLAYRAAVAASGYLMLEAPIAIYPSWKNSSNESQTSSDGSFDLAADEAYVYTFSRKPKLQATGFWSLTAYANNFLIPNDLNRYAVGDRSNLTYPDGSLVYGADASSTDGPFQVIVQAADNPPPANWTSNWVPGPAEGGSMGVWLRFYLAEQDLLDGTYEYPVVERTSAIVGTGNEDNGTATSTLSGSSPTSPTSLGAASTPSNSADGGALVLRSRFGIFPELTTLSLAAWLAV